MNIKNFLKNKIKSLSDSVRQAKAVSVDDAEEIKKGKLLEERFEDAADPLVAERYAPSTLLTFLALYASHPWVYVAANAIATSAASVPFQLLKKSGSTEIGGEEVKNGKAIAPYLDKPNPNMTWHELMETTMLHLELAGNSYWEIVNDSKTGNGKILAIYPLRPDRMKIWPDAKKKIDKYEYQVSGNDFIYFKPEEIIHLKYTDARSEFYGVPPISSIQNEITLDFNATSWNKNFFKNGAEPGGVLETDKSLTVQAWERLRLNWFKRHKGLDKVGEVAILEEGLKYRQITSKHADMQYYEMKAWNRDTILAIMRVPQVIVGVSTKLSVGTERDQKKIFWHNNVIPKLQKIQHVINAYLMPEGIQFAFNIKAIDSIIEDDQVKTTIVQSNIAHGVMTINEARKKYYGLDTVEWGDTWWRPVGVVDVKNPVVAVPAEPGTGSDTGSPTGQRVTTGAKAGLGNPHATPTLRNQKSITDSFLDFEKIELDEPNWDDANSVKDYQEFTIIKANAGPDEKRFRKLLTDFFNDQAARILDKVESGWPIRKDSSDPEDGAMDKKEENKLLYAALIGMLYSIYKKYGTLLIDDLVPGKKFDVASSVVKSWIEKHAEILVDQINSTTKDLVKSLLSEAKQMGEDLTVVYEKLSKLLTGDSAVFRVLKIARTELLTLANNARLEAAKQSGIVTKKRWVCALIPTSRNRPHAENHVGMHNTIVKLNEKFHAPKRGGGYDLMDGPGDTSAHPENVINCLCYVSYSSDDKETLPQVEK